jgi:hypothetical protein
MAKKLIIITYFLIGVGFGMSTHENHHASHRPVEILASATIGVLWPMFVGSYLAKVIES